MAEISAVTVSPHRRQLLREWAMTTFGTLLGGVSMTQNAHAGSQIDEPLSDAVRTALSAAVMAAAPPEPLLSSPAERERHAQWLSLSSQYLARWMASPQERQEFLQTLWYEARRAGLSLSLVLGLIQTESAFRKYAISSAGARGYMQVMPFWVRTLGDGDASRLFHMQTNLRFGCVILRYFLDREQSDLSLGLGRYNGSRGQLPYPRAVLSARQGWLQVVD